MDTRSERSANFCEQCSTPIFTEYSLSSTKSGMSTPNSPMPVARTQTCPPLTQLKVSPTSEIAGITYENAYGRHVVIYWQAESPEGKIYESTFLQKDLNWELKEVSLIATGAKPNTPIAAVTWANGVRRAVYFLNPWNLICERLCKSGYLWSDGTLNDLEVSTRSNSGLGAAVSDGVLIRHLAIYYQDWENNIHRLEYNQTTGWQEVSFTGIDSKALSGTSIACLSSDVYHWVYTLNYQRYVQEFFSSNTTKWALFKGSPSFLNQTWDRDAKISIPQRILGVFQFYCCDATKVCEKKWQPSAWLNGTILPGSATKMVARNFVSLCWGKDIDNSATEIHLFSIKEGRVMDYLVGSPTGASISLTEVE